MQPYHYSYTDIRGHIVERNLHMDGTASVHPRYLEWSQDEIIDRMRRHVDQLNAVTRRETSYCNERLRWIASLRALYNFNRTRGHN